MNEQEAALRAAIVVEAWSWVGTPYVDNGMIKGPRGGTDCAMLLVGVYGSLGFVPKEFDPRPYPSDWHVHRNEEKYMNYVRSFADEVPGPPLRMPLPGDLVMFKVGRVFAHGAIIVAWPNVIHAVGADRVLPEDISTNTTGKRALWRLDKTFFKVRSFAVG